MEMKKIGILTFHNAINYGGMLQCYALQEFLKGMNYEVSIINYESYNIKNDNKLLNFNSIKDALKSIITFIPNRIRYKRYNSFMITNLSLTKKIKSYEELKEMAERDFDIIVVGSDQVWNTDIINGEEKVYYLENIKTTKISYAASTGDNNKKSLDYIAKNYKNFRNISVREISTKNELEEKYNIATTLNIDPTFLLSKDEWKHKLKLQDQKNSSLLLYILSDDKRINPLAKKVKKIYDLDDIYTFSKKSFGIKNIKSLAMSGPLEFVEEFNNSRVVITNSFHGTAFALIFNKDFYVILPEKRKERILSILQRLELTDRIISTIDDINNLKISHINYNIVNMKINEMTNDSLKYIKNNIGE